MKYCTRCGNGLDDYAVVCTKCGCMAGPVKKVKMPKAVGDSLSRESGASLTTIFNFISDIFSIAAIAGILFSIGLTAYVMYGIAGTMYTPHFDENAALVALIAEICAVICSVLSLVFAIARHEGIKGTFAAIKRLVFALAIFYPTLIFCGI